MAGQLDLLPRVKHSVAPVARRLRLCGHGSKKCKNIYPGTWQEHLPDRRFQSVFSFTRFPLKNQFLTHGHVCDAPLQNPRSPRSEYSRPYRAQRPSFLGSWVPVSVGFQDVIFMLSTSEESEMMSFGVLQGRAKFKVTWSPEQGQDEEFCLIPAP